MSSKEIQLYNPHTDLVMAVLRSPRIGQTPEPEAQARFAQMVDAVAFILNSKHLTAEDADMIALLVTSQAREEKLVADLTWEEAGKALQDGAFGKYGKVYGINAATIYNFLMEFALSDEKHEINRKVVALRTDQERKRQEKVAAFLEAHPAYAEIIRKNHIENLKQTRK
jgi:hypothetical protein